MAETAPSTSKRRRLLITAPGAPGTPQEDLQATAPGGTIVSTPGHDFQRNLLQAIRDQVEKSGTLEMLVISSHGTTLTLDAGLPTITNTTQFVNVQKIFDELKNLQQELGVKIADRIVLHACSVFTDMKPEEVAYFRGTAKDLGTQIAGATSRWYGGSLQYATVIHFDPDGTVGKDALTKWPSPFSSFNQWLTSSIAEWNNPHSDAWFHCHEGKTQEQGAACQRGEEQRFPQARVDSRDAAKLKQPGADPTSQKLHSDPVPPPFIFPEMGLF
jgi:hypothetical protein